MQVCVWFAALLILSDGKVAGLDEVRRVSCGAVWIVAIRGSDATFRDMLSAHFDYELDQVNIKAALLNGELEEKIYFVPPEGSKIPAGSIFRLCKSLYGLRQSP